MFLYLAILHILNGFDLHCKLQSDYNSFSMRVWSKKRKKRKKRESGICYIYNRHL